MQPLMKILDMASQKTRQDSLVLSEEAAALAARDASVRTLKEICALALRTDAPDGEILRKVRALCLSQQLSFREQGI